MYPILKEEPSSTKVPTPPTISLKTLMGRNLKSAADSGMPSLRQMVLDL